MWQFGNTLDTSGRTALNHSNWSDFGQRGVACLPGVGFWSLCGCAVDRGAPIKHTCRCIVVVFGWCGYHDSKYKIYSTNGTRYKIVYMQIKMYIILPYLTLEELMLTVYLLALSCWICSCVSALLYWNLLIIPAMAWFVVLLMDDGSGDFLTRWFSWHSCGPGTNDHGFL